MKTEMEKCLAGEWYDCHNQVFLDLKTRTHKLLMKYNSLPYENKEKKHSLLKKMLGSIGMKVSVASPFICDYGCNIHIGDNVMIGPNVTLATPMHPLLPEERNIRKRQDGSFYNLEYAKPITIKDNCWLASNVVVCGGVTIGEGCVIGAGSVVTRDIPPYSLAAGNPCRVIRKITEKDLMSDGIEKF